MKKSSGQKKFQTAAARWAGVGPYYAMFPSTFSDKVVEKHTKTGDVVLDPFAGRGTAIFSAAVKGRVGVGIEISPLGFVYANAKLSTGNMKKVKQKLQLLVDTAEYYSDEAEQLSEFFHCCFSVNVRKFLLAARAKLNWKHSKVDRTLMALILLYLHGKRGQSLSNQMRQSTAMAPDYSVRWWREKGFSPPDIDPLTFLEKRIDWRYVHGVPETGNSRVYLANSIQKLPCLVRETQEGRRKKADLLVTSPPYHNVVNYYYDQWIRIWLLGGPENPQSNANCYGGKFSNRQQYRGLLEQVFRSSKPFLSDDAVLYIRTDKKKTTQTATLEILQQVFPEKSISVHNRPIKSNKRTKPYSRGGAPKENNCEIDIILQSR